MTIRLAHQTEYDDQQLVQYLLGLLPMERTERLDEEGIADDDVAARLRIAEQDLVDAYVRGTLTGEMLERFESHYLSSSLRRERVAFARRFVPAVDRAVIPAGAAEERVQPGPNLVRRMGVAAALLLVACGMLLLLTVRTRSGAESPEGAPVNRDSRQSVPQPVKPGPHRESAVPAQTLPVVALLLPQTRSIGPVTALAIPAGADRVGLELRLEANDLSRYQVGLRDPAINRIVWRSGWIASASRAGQPSIVLAIPAGLLKPQHYALDLTGRGTGVGPEVAGSYVFEILPR
jgi:hypothetical protein